MSKLLDYGDSARGKVLGGVRKLAKTVSVTMGPRGKNVIIGRSVGAPTITKDGVSVAREVVLLDPVEELGCQLVKEVAGRTADVAGDGTTTSIVLAHEIFERGVSCINDGISPLEFKRGLEWAVSAIVEELNTMAKPIDTEDALRDIAVIATNNDEKLGGLIAQAFSSVDNTGMVTAEAVPGSPDSLRIVDGIELNSGYVSSEFLNKGESKRTLNDCLILICDREITHLNDPKTIAAIQRLEQTRKNILFIAPNIEKHGLAFLIKNHKAGTLKVCAIKTPKFGKRKEQWLQDLATLTGGTIVGEDHGIPLEDVMPQHLGYAEKVEVGAYKTKIINPSTDHVRVEERRAVYQEDLLRSLGDFDKKDIRDRLAFLNNKAAVIQVGYSTELELREKGDRIEDAIFAVYSALEEGYVVGGGFALLRAAETVRKNLTDKCEGMASGVDVLLNACLKPANQILMNAGLNFEEILESLPSDPVIGYNTVSEEFVELEKAGVIDPKKVTRTALQNAASIALLLITTDAVIADDPGNPSGWQPVAGYRLPEQRGFNHKY